jgi:hypothetical protein
MFNGLWCKVKFQTVSAVKKIEGNNARKSNAEIKFNYGITTILVQKSCFSPSKLINMSHIVPHQRGPTRLKLIIEKRRNNVVRCCGAKSCNQNVKFRSRIPTFKVKKYS